MLLDTQPASVVGSVERDNTKTRERTEQSFVTAGYGVALKRKSWLSSR
jgi:hypothetical protein